MSHTSRMGMLFMVLLGASPALATDLTGTVLWTDKNDATHPVRGIYVQLFRTHDDGRPHEFIGTALTDSEGKYSYPTGLTLMDVHSGWQAIGFSDGVAARINSTGTTGGGAYSVRTSSVATAALPDMVADKYGTDGRSFAIADALYSSWYYANHMTTGVTKRLVQFPAASTSFDHSTELLNIEDDRWNQWDAINHEYGHYLNKLSTIANQPHGVGHTIGTSSIPTSIGKDAGCRLAWGEGLATYQGIAAQRYDVAGQHTPITAPFVGDTFFSSALSSVGIEDDFGVAITQGEGDELAVARILWDLVDGGDDEAWDQYSIPEPIFYDDLKSIPDLDRLDDVWDHFAAITSDAGRADLGAIFEHNGVSPKPVDFILDSFPSTITPLKFFWEAGNNLENDDFGLLIFDEGFSTKIGSWIVGSDLSYTPSALEWATLTDWVTVHGDTTFKWVVIGADRFLGSVPYPLDEITGDYWSGAHDLTLIAPVPAPGALALAGTCLVTCVRGRRR